MVDHLLKCKKNRTDLAVGGGGAPIHRDEPYCPVGVRLFFSPGLENMTLGRKTVFGFHCRGAPITRPWSPQRSVRWGDPRAPDAGGQGRGPGCRRLVAFGWKPTDEIMGRGGEESRGRRHRHQSKVGQTGGNVGINNCLWHKRKPNKSGMTS